MLATSSSDPRFALYLVEPCAVVTEALTSIFEDKVRTIACFRSAESLLRASNTLSTRSLLIAELQLPGINGIELMLALKRENLSTPTIITALEPSICNAVSAIRHGAIDFVEKPCKADELLDGLYRCEMVTAEAQVAHEDRWRHYVVPAII